MFNTRDGLFTLGRLRGEMDRLFTDAFRAPSQANGGYQWEAEYPAINVWEDESSFHAEAELPGYKLDDLSITVVKNELMLKGERKLVEDETRTFHRRERAAGSFSRVIHLPTAVNAEKVEATIADGVLLLRLPKAEEAKPRKIRVTCR